MIKELIRMIKELIRMIKELIRMIKELVGMIKELVLAVIFFMLPLTTCVLHLFKIDNNLSDDPIVEKIRYIKKTYTFHRRGG